MMTWWLPLVLLGSLGQSKPGVDTQPVVLPDRPAAPVVWVIGEGFRVDPISGRVREEWRKGNNPIPADFDYTHKNLAWDAENRQIALHAARNEIVSCQVQIRGPAKNVTLVCSDLSKGSRAIHVQDGDIELFKQWYLHVPVNSTNKDSVTAGYNMGTGWYADALIPMARDSAGASQPFDIPDALNKIPNQQWQSVWVDIYVPKDLPAGEYKGEIRVSAEGIKQRLGVSITVHDVTLSDDFHCEAGLNNYGSIGTKGSAVRLTYYQMAHKHRMAVHEHYIAPKVKGTGAKMTGVWKAYDTEMGKYLDGTAFTAEHGYRGPGEGKPLRWVYLPFDILGSHAWPMAKSAMHTSEYDAAVRAMLKDFAGHFAQKGWTRTDRMFFVNGLDEPVKPEAVDEIRYFGELVQSVGAARTYYRGDINHLHDIDKVIPGYTEEKMLEKLFPVMGLWCCVADFKRTDFSQLLGRKPIKPGLVTWFYQNREPSVGGYTLDDETIGLATWPVIAWKYGLEGCILWELGFTGPSKNPWVDPVNSERAEGGTVHNLAGFVIYPSMPEEPEITEPVASIRLKSFRRGAQDYEYLRLLQNVAGRQTALNLLSSVLGHCLYEPHRSYGEPGDWSHNPQDWNRFRVEVLEAIDRTGHSEDGGER